MSPAAADSSKYSTQLGLFERPAPPTRGREELLAHKWWGNRCPACGALAGELCKGRGDDGKIHGMRTRFAAPGVYMVESDDEWGRGPRESDDDDAAE